MSSGGGTGERAAADFVLQCAETCYADASIAFEKAKDRVNAALVGLNRAQACRARAAWNLPQGRRNLLEVDGSEARTAGARAGEG